MNPFVYDALPGRVVFGPGASREKLADEMDRLGADRVLLIATEHERPLAEDRLDVLYSVREVGAHLPPRPLCVPRLDAAQEDVPEGV